MKVVNETMGFKCKGSASKRPSVRHRSTQRPLETHHITLASNLKLKQSIIHAFVLPLGKWYTQTDWAMSFSLRYGLHHGYRRDASLNFVALV